MPTTTGSSPLSNSKRSCSKLYQGRNRSDRWIANSLSRTLAATPHPLSPLFLAPRKSLHQSIMPPKSSPDKEHAKQKISLERLMHKRNINFYPLDDPLPPSLQRESNAVQAIEDATYEENWQRSSHGTKKRTNAILEAVLRCLEKKSNEDDWRHEVETKILRPLTKRPAW